MTIKKIVLFLLLSAMSVSAQEKITLEQIWGGYFRTQGMQELQAMKNSNEYTVLNRNSIDLYDFATLEKKKMLFSTKDFSIDSYTFSEKEDKILIATNSEYIYRHSFTADYYVFDIPTQKLTKFTDKKIQEPVFSPNGKKIAYAFENNLYVYDLDTETETKITSDGQKNHIINGITDWVYEEEFGFVRAFEWNKTGDKIAYLRFDETDVPEFSMDVYGNGLYPTQQVFKYPKAGEKNSKVSLKIYDVIYNDNLPFNLVFSNSDGYCPRIKWTNNPDILSYTILNRHQNELKLSFFDIVNRTMVSQLTETDKAYVDIHDNLTFLDDNSFIWTSEKDGFNHIFHYDKNAKLIRQITKGNWEVTQFYGYDAKTKTIFYQSTENGSTNRDVYKIGLNGKNKVRLSSQNGTNKATFSPNYEYFINSFSSATEPPKYTLNEVKSGKEIKTITDNTALSEKLKNYNLPTKEFFELTTEKRHQLNAYIIKPKDFDPNKKYPLLMFQYSGPGSQQVANQWLNTNDYWHMMLAQQGYLVACVDGRGTGFKGANFKKVTQKELGRYEVEDQIDAAKEFAKYPYIAKERIGIWGWSYGGFMSSNCILKGNDVFKTAIAVAPVTNWRFYDTIYTERYMTTPQENPSGYDDNSPINHVDKLKGNYLIIHGTADDNVHVQNAMQMIRALQLANKQFDQAVYPDTNHGIYGGKIRLQLYTFMTNYIKEKL
ncbi:MAG: S9 family peptidase [Flavobacteriaceae bacterium]|jgi:dipeptidyl-peptidase-4|nr:S9 family peptidase [Flavobacteriaceae bacterium]